MEQLAEQIHLFRSTLGSYGMEDFRDISHCAPIRLAKLHSIIADYLLGPPETKNRPNANFVDLRMSGDTIELLKSGLVDNFLLCELVVYPNPSRLMVDLEIYVNGAVVKQAQNVNAIVGITSAAIMKQYNLGLPDSQPKQFIAAYIGDDSSCRYIIQQDINGIALDLREAHKNDFFSVPEDNPLEGFSQAAETTSTLGSDPEQAVVVFICKRLRLNYGKLSEEERRWLERIAQKSNLLRNPKPQRGRKQRGKPGLGKGVYMKR